MHNQIRPIQGTEQPLRKWKVLVDGQELAGASLVELQSTFGTLRYGWTAANYDSWSFHQNGGGGVVVLPYAVRGGVLLVGLVEQDRYGEGGTVLNAPRGFLDPDERHHTASSRELDEETGLRSLDTRELDGEPLNPNSAFFDTSTPGEGVRMYCAPIPADWLEKTPRGWTVAEHRLAASEENNERLRERIGKLVFIDWIEATRVSDMFSVAAIGRLLAALVNSNELKLS